MLHRFVLVFLVASVDVYQCHSFKHVKRKSTPPISATLGQRFCLRSHCCRHQNCCRRHLNSAKQLLYSVRGGSDQYEKNEDTETTHSFISSFELELAQIRREISMEAENEIQKLRGLIEGRDEEEEENEMDPKERGNINGSNVSSEVEGAIGDDHDEPTGNDDVVQEEKLQSDEDEGAAENIDQSEMGFQNEMQVLHGATGRREDVQVDDIHESNKSDEVEDIPDSDGDGPIENHVAREGGEESLSDEGDVESIHQADIESDKMLPKDETTEAVDESEIESDSNDDKEEGSDSAEDGENLQHYESEYTRQSNEDSGFATLGSEGKSAGDTHSKAKTNEGVNQKKTKKKRKRKRRKKVRNARIKLLDEGDLSDDGQIDLGESILLTRTQNEVMQPRQSGIWFYLRSDLGRALTLFVATIILAILTKRVERQMEAEGI